MSPAVFLVNPRNSRAATLFSFSGSSKGALVEGSNGRIRTEADGRDVEELRLP